MSPTCFHVKIYDHQYFHCCCVIFNFLILHSFLCISLPAVFDRVSLFTAETTLSLAFLELFTVALSTLTVQYVHLIIRQYFIAATVKPDKNI